MTLSSVISARSRPSGPLLERNRPFRTSLSRVVKASAVVLGGAALITAATVDSAQAHVPNLAIYNVPAPRLNTSAGVHETVIPVKAQRVFRAMKSFSSFSGRCYTVGRAMTIPGYVGFFNDEASGMPCVADTFQVAFTFETSKLDAFENKQILSATLLATEVPGEFCNWVVDGRDRTCWQDGNGNPADKPGGCVLVRVPSVDWRSDARNFSEVQTLANGPTIERSRPGEWDITRIFDRQHGAGAPLGQVPGYGIVLVGRIDFGHLTGEDNTVCISRITNVAVRVRYQAFAPGPGPIVR